ncbi:hypothetical protein DXG01_001682 [Tephrocybe rancida]|nr:hypothetical protein DXG01_001682 [Tephrocybe rancida]
MDHSGNNVVQAPLGYIYEDKGEAPGALQHERGSSRPVTWRVFRSYFYHHFPGRWCVRDSMALVNSPAKGLPAPALTATNTGYRIQVWRPSRKVSLGAVGQQMINSIPHRVLTTAAEGRGAALQNFHKIGMFVYLREDVEIKQQGVQILKKGTPIQITSDSGKRSATLKPEGLEYAYYLAHFHDAGFWIGNPSGLQVPHSYLILA